MASPILSIGTFGVHIICCSDIYSFTGNVPSGLKAGGYKSEFEAIDAFIVWFRSQDLSFQREHAANLRNDVFAAFLTAPQR